MAPNCIACGNPFEPYTKTTTVCVHCRCRAWNAVTGALASGALVREPCEVCAGPKSEAHHEDYAKPLTVRWLCRRHHVDRHLELRRAAA